MRRRWQHARGRLWWRIVGFIVASVVDVSAALKGIPDQLEMVPTKKGKETQAVIFISDDDVLGAVRDSQSWKHGPIVRMKWTGEDITLQQKKSAYRITFSLTHVQDETYVDVIPLQNCVHTCHDGFSIVDYLLHAKTFGELHDPSLKIVNLLYTLQSGRALLLLLLDKLRLQGSRVPR